MSDLSNYGNVKTCGMVSKNVAVIVVTNFDNEATNTLDFLSDAKELFPDLDHVSVCEIENDFAMLVLKRK